MLGQNVFFVASRTFLIETLGDFLSFPVWWYTKGFVHIARNRIVGISSAADNLALRLLLLNIFKPMFGQYDRAGRVISFFMRIIILIGRLIYLAIYSLLQVALLLLWVAAPIVIVWRLVTIVAISYVGF